MSELSQEQFELIEAYLRETMSAEERAAFEQRLEQDEALRKEVAIQKENMMAVELGAFTESIEQIADDYSKENPAIEPAPAKNSGSGKWIGIAAGIAALLAVTFWISSNGDTTKDILAEYYTADPGLPVTMGMTDDPEFADAMVDYKAGKYKKALAKWSTLESAAENDTIRYYIASAHLANKDAGKAAPIFLELSKESESAFSHKAQWYLLMAHLQLGEIEQAKKLEVSPDSPYLDEATVIKERLNQ